MSIIKELEARKLDISNRPHIANPYNEAIDDAIEIVTKHTAPQPNWEEVEKLVREYATLRVAQVTDKQNDGYESILRGTLRTRIGYTLDANGKPVAIQKGGEGNG